MALALDGSAVHANGLLVSTKNLPGLSTSNANDVILLYILSWGSPNTAFATPTDTARLTWTQRGHWTNPVASGERIELWYGIASGALSGDVITIATSGAVSVSQLSGTAIAISGANTSSPFDANASLPAFGLGSNPTISTSNANDFLVAFQTYSSANGAPSSTHTSWTLLFNDNSATIGYSEYYDIIASTLSSETITRGVAGSLSDIVVDAVQAAGAGGGGAPLFLTADLNGLGSGGPFFHDRLAS